ncbi:MAG: hypothetical protein R3326_01835 [Gemmatimonadota bacterium]|nr:hypothetical protein [Gemmatimonadota bacterium]
MNSENRANGMQEEIAEIEDRRGTRNLFLILGGIVGAILLVIVIVGARERARIAELEARPKTEPVEMGTLVGTVSNQAVFSRGERLTYVEGIGEAEVTSDTRFVREIEYNQAGEPDTIPTELSHWSLVSSDSLPYVVEPVTNPLLGVNPTDYQELELGSMRREDYGSGGPGDWRPLEREGENIQVTGEASREDDSVYLTSDSVRARLQGIEGLAPVDSLEVAWATENNAPLTGYGRITNTPRGADEALFVVTVNSVQPPESVTGGATAPPDTTATVDTTGQAADTSAQAGGTTGGS